MNSEESTNPAPSESSPERPAADNAATEATAETYRKSGPAEEPPQADGFRKKVHDVIFEADTRLGRAFDIGLLLLILISVSVVMLESDQGMRKHWGAPLMAVDWTITVIFTLEYLIRLWCVRRPWRYALSFFGIVDLLSIAPTYLRMVVDGSQALVVIRTLRLIRAFRIFKLSRYVAESQGLLQTLRRAGFAQLAHIEVRVAPLAERPAAERPEKPLSAAAEQALDSMARLGAKSED